MLTVLVAVVMLPAASVALQLTACTPSSSRNVVAGTAGAWSTVQLEVATPDSASVVVTTTSTGVRCQPAAAFTTTVGAVTSTL